MKWDVFISHASEDKGFVKKLAESLESKGLRVWYDSLTLHPGDSLRRKIDEGLAKSSYGIVVLSKKFFEKEWPKKELDGLVAREDGSGKVIIPIWHEVTASDVRNFSPPLADRLSIYSSDPVEEIVEKIVRAIYQDKIEKNGWTAPLYHFPGAADLILPPICPYNNHAIGLSRHPITNSQYQRFIDETGYKTPVGETLVDGEWRGPFIPMEEDGFNLPNQPVVCVDFRDIHMYCQWLTSKMNQGIEDILNLQGWAFIPHVSLWDFAATGQRGSISESVKLIIPEGQWHQKAEFPAPIETDGERTNEFGLSDMFGNVWEWCYAEFSEPPALIARPRHTEIELRGGGFLDDLGKIRPHVNTDLLANGLRTRHTDLGFRIGVMISINRLSTEDRIALSLQERFRWDFWEAATYPLMFNFDYEHLLHSQCILDID